MDFTCSVVHIGSALNAAFALGALHSFIGDGFHHSNVQNMHAVKKRTDYRERDLLDYVLCPKNGSSLPV